MVCTRVLKGAYYNRKGTIIIFLYQNIGTRENQIDQDP
jgi:hypothetical protein